jgi:hypothetical protein
MDLFLNGRTDTGVPQVQGVPSTATQPASVPPGGSAQKAPVGFEKEYGHAL